MSVSDPAPPGPRDRSGGDDRKSDREPPDRGSSGREPSEREPFGREPTCPESPDPEPSEREPSSRRPSDRGPSGREVSERELDSYWARNQRYLAVLLAIWFLVSYGAGILFVDVLNRVRIPGTGFELGFWFAQQGSIVTFVVLIFVYVVLMNRLDRRHGFREE